MAHTHRNSSYSSCALRKPRTTNEIRQAYNLLIDNQIEDYNLSGVNRLRSRYSNLPTHWDDIVCSSYYQNDYNKDSNFYVD